MKDLKLTPCIENSIECYQTKGKHSRAGGLPIGSDRNIPMCMLVMCFRLFFVFNTVFVFGVMDFFFFVCVCVCFEWFVNVFNLR
jgi:hypothetical protein